MRSFLGWEGRSGNVRVPLAIVENRFVSKNTLDDVLAVLCWSLRATSGSGRLGRSGAGRQCAVCWGTGTCTRRCPVSPSTTRWRTCASGGQPALATCETQEPRRLGGPRGWTTGGVVRRLLARLSSCPVLGLPFFDVALAWIGGVSWTSVLALTGLDSGGAASWASTQVRALRSVRVCGSTSRHRVDSSGAKLRAYAAEVRGPIPVLKDVTLECLSDHDAVEQAVKRATF